MIYKPVSRIEPENAEPPILPTRGHRVSHSRVIPKGGKQQQRELKTQRFLEIPLPDFIAV